ncbi:Inpp5b [Symbiodinium sp. CCMP2456]|nr:Inpp5b [Symbiodinium sp. CCMP2456]
MTVASVPTDVDVVPEDVNVLVPKEDAPGPQPWQSMKILCFTWNMGDAKPAEEELEHWLPKKGGDYDLVAVGVQECSYDPGSSPSRNPKRRKSLKGSGKVQLPMLSGAVEEAWHTLGSSPRSSDKSPERRVRDVREEAFTFHWDDILAERLGDGFTRVQQVVLMSMRLLVFARTEYCDGTFEWCGGPLVHSVQQTYSATGLMAGTVGNKGGLVVTLQFGPTRLCFVSCHLAAHLSAGEKRNSDCREILQETWPVCHPDLDLSCEFDHCFWFGDLNYRLDLAMSDLRDLPTVALGKAKPSSGKEIPTGPSTLSAPSNPSRPDHFSAILDMVEGQLYDELMRHDQLRLYRQAGKAFVGFREGNPSFPPTFKVERASGTKHQEERTPSYCDRILWKSLDSLEGCVTQQELASPAEVTTSDHKPVFARFKVEAPASLGQLFQKQLSPDKFPAVQVTQLKARGVNSGQGAKFRVLFIVTPLELNTARYESAVRQMREPTWRVDELPVLRPAATCQDELNSCSVILVLYNKNIRLGSVGLRFPGYDSSHTLSGQRFRLDFDKPIVNRLCPQADLDLKILQGRLPDLQLQKSKDIAVVPYAHISTCPAPFVDFPVLAHPLLQTPKETRCPLCNEELVEVLLTNRRDASFDPKDVLGLNYEVPWTYFGDDTIRRAAGQLLGYRCQMEGCEKRDVAFNTLKKLEEHLWHSHWRQLCNVCLHHRPAFVCEQRAYASNDMERHFREGDAAFMSTEHPTSSAASVPPHPKCEFCGQRFFNDESLLAHMQMKHEVCNLCDSMGWKNEYYLNPKCLSRHYQECHYVCAHPDCATGGYRQIAFADEKGLEDHYIRVHKQTFVQEKGKNKLEINWFQDSNRHRGKGSGRGSLEDVDPVHFRWPETATPEDYARDAEAEDHARRDGNFKRYPRRDIIPLAIKGSDEGGWRAKDQEVGGGVEQNGSVHLESEQVEVPLQPGTAPEDSTAKRRAEKKEPEKKEQALLPAMEALGVECAVASDGPRSGAPSCLSALWGALCAILEEDDQEDRDTVLLPVIQRLNAAEVENLESMRIHLHDCPGDPGAAEHSIDWAPLERLLSLRPLLFRLLRDKTNQTKANNSSASNRRLIGPRQGPAAEQEQDEAKAWREWKVAAQAVILAMEPKAQQRVLRYVALCVQRRTALDNRDAGVPDWEDEENLQQDFPSLGEAPVQSSGAEVSSLARHARGRYVCICIYIYTHIHICRCMCI